jgi:hypothetical protein
LTDAQLSAHLRMLGELRHAGRVRTHEQRPIIKEHGHKRTAEEHLELIKQLRDMEEHGCTRKQMRTACKCTNRTVIRVLGPSVKNPRNKNGKNQHDCPRKSKAPANR